MNSLYPRKKPFWTVERRRLLFIILLLIFLTMALGLLGAMEPIEIYNMG